MGGTQRAGGKYIVKLQLNKLKLVRVKQPTLKLQKAKFCPQQLLKSKLPSVDLCEFNCLESPATSESVSLIWEIAEPSLGSLWRRDHLAAPHSMKGSTGCSWAESLAALAGCSQHSATLNGPTEEALGCISLPTPL